MTRPKGSAVSNNLLLNNHSPPLEKIRKMKENEIMEIKENEKFLLELKEGLLLRSALL